MSEENVETARRFAGALASRDVARAVESLDPAAEWHNTAVFPGPRTVVGAEAIGEFWTELMDAYSDSDSGMEVEEVVGGSEVVAVHMHGWGRGRGSGIPLDERWAHTLRIRSSKVQRIDTYGSFTRALEAAGLSE